MEAFFPAPVLETPIDISEPWTGLSALMLVGRDPPLKRAGLFKPLCLGCLQEPGLHGWPPSGRAVWTTAQTLSRSGHGPEGQGGAPPVRGQTERHVTSQLSAPGIFHQLVGLG